MVLSSFIVAKLFICLDVTCAVGIRDVERLLSPYTSLCSYILLENNMLYLPIADEAALGQL